MKGRDYPIAGVVTGLSLALCSAILRCREVPAWLGGGPDCWFELAWRPGIFLAAFGAAIGYAIKPRASKGDRADEVESDSEVARCQEKARISLYLGIASILLFFLGPVAVVMGYRAQSELSRLGIRRGKGAALAGILLGAVTTVVYGSVLLLLFWPSVVG